MMTDLLINILVILYRQQLVFKVSTMEKTQPARLLLLSEPKYPTLWQQWTGKVTTNKALFDSRYDPLLAGKLQELQEVRRFEFGTVHKDNNTDRHFLYINENTTIDGCIHATASEIMKQYEPKPYGILLNIKNIDIHGGCRAKCLIHTSKDTSSIVEPKLDPLV
jgi:hypothetical protein